MAGGSQAWVEKTLSGEESGGRKRRVRSETIPVSTIRDEGWHGPKLPRSKELPDLTCQGLPRPLRALRKGFAGSA